MKIWSAAPSWAAYAMHKGIALRILSLCRKTFTTDG
jgi:hypothetical protein